MVDFIERATLYQSQCECPDTKVKHKTVSADDLLAYIKPLLGTTLTNWRTKDTQRFARFISDVASVDCGISSPEAVEVWLSFEPLWSSYVSSHPRIMALVRVR